MIRPQFTQSLLVVLALTISACTPQNSPQDTTAQSADDGNNAFVGCFSVQKNAPAQIRITHDGTTTMQMKEPDGTWDKPEPMVSVDNDKAWQFFAKNGLGLEQSYLQATIVRHDEVMAMGKVDGALMAVNPSVDSPFVMSLFGATNTIYQVECDSEPLVLDTTNNPHSK